MKRHYYNEYFPHAAAWLRKLIAAGLIPDGDVDERSITDVAAIDLTGYIQCHFFAGIGGWPLALRLAGWPQDREVWTGSCPCQPYSVASVAHGGAQGQSDSRHLWPKFGSLIAQCRPPIVFGEQVESAIGWAWWDEAALDLEAEDYACAAAVLPAVLFGAAHQRERLCWVADAGSTRWQGHQQDISISGCKAETFPEYGNPLADARRALDGDYSHLLPCDGVSVVLERLATHGYGNAIVPQVAQAFIESVM